jgi:hypothetical protein
VDDGDVHGCRHCGDLHGRKTRDGLWSVDASGRLTADLTGEQATADAWIAGDRLTIVVDGTGLTFTRGA